MPSGKEIKNKIKSVKNTRKITKAMQMVAASKMKKAQDIVAAARPYSDKLSEVLANLAERHPEYRHPFLDERPNIKAICAIVVTSDKGLCGGLNSNLLREVIRFVRENEGKKIKLITVGRKGLAFLRRFNVEIIAEITGVSEKPTLLDLVPAITIATNEYKAGNVDQVVCFYSRFVNTMSQKPTERVIVPVPLKDGKKKPQPTWDYLYEPEAKDVLSTLITRYLETVVYLCALESSASEQSARMVAMKAATENAGDMIDRLNLMYNKSRQAAITKELAEIVGGANAIS